MPGKKELGIFDANITYYISLRNRKELAGRELIELEWYNVGRDWKTDSWVIKEEQWKNRNLAE